MSRKSVYGSYGGRNDDVAGAFDYGDGNNVAGAFDNGNGNDNNVETIYLPTENIVNTRTNRRTIRRVHPTHIENVNRNITRVENYFPTTESVENENYVEEYNCGSSLQNPCCRPVKRCNDY